MADYKIQKFPKSRIATFDAGEISRGSHHVSALIDVDVTKSLEKIRLFKATTKQSISFTAWLISVISFTLKKHLAAASYLQGKRKLIIFNDVNLSVLVEKEINGQKVPIPLLIEKSNEKTIQDISGELSKAKHEKLTEKAIVLQKKSKRLENLYFVLPAFVRRLFWKYTLSHPHFAYHKMGNVALTSIGMFGKIDGWFIPFAIHPLCFGIGSILKKPMVIEDKIEIREMLKMTILVNHDVIDGGPMAEFIIELINNMENAVNLD